MALQLPPELEQRVIALAHATGRDPAVVYAELVAAGLDAWDARGIAGDGATPTDPQPDGGFSPA